MSFSVGDIPFFREYQFTDTGGIARHFGLVLLPETATKYQGSLLCCVITSRKTKRWSLILKSSSYSCFRHNSYACFDKKDLVSMSGLENSQQPKTKLNEDDFKRAYKILKKSLFVIKDLAYDPFMRAVIIYEWKKALGLV
jgi:hypothetical protein